MNTEMFSKADALWVPRKPPPLPPTSPVRLRSPLRPSCHPQAAQVCTLPSSPSALGSSRARDSGAELAAWHGGAHRVSLSWGPPHSLLLWSGVSTIQTIFAWCLWFSARFSHHLLFSSRSHLSFSCFLLSRRGFVDFQPAPPPNKPCATFSHPCLSSPECHWFCALGPVRLPRTLSSSAVRLFLTWGDRFCGGAVGSLGAGGSPVLVKVGPERLILISLRSPLPVRPEFLPSVGQPCCLKRVLMPRHLLGALPSETPRLEVYFPGIQWRLSLIKIQLW